MLDSWTWLDATEGLGASCRRGDAPQATLVPTILQCGLTLNTGTLHVEDGKAKVSVPCTWPKQSLVKVGLLDNKSSRRVVLGTRTGRLDSSVYSGLGGGPAG